MPATATTEPDIAGGIVAIERMVFAWWNTSLSPVGKQRSDNNHQQIANRVVKSLIDELNVDCLALGEVTSSDLSSMIAACETTSLGVYEGTLKEGRLQFDTGIIYNTSRLGLEDSFFKTSAHGIRNYKVFNKVEFVSVSDGLPIYVFAAHWPSRATNEEGRLIRETIAGGLKDAVRKLTKSSPNAAIIVMGDFNDEPFDESLAWHMLGTRDRRLAKSANDYLYNPFWRRLGESEPYSITTTRPGVAGTCFYKGDTTTRWKTFDQMLFSPAFLGDCDWHLNEDEAMILETDFLTELVQNDKFYFDHLPIICIVEKLKKEV
jgi:Endonuclease/Exonuclease/phosphatase family